MKVKVITAELEGDMVRLTGYGRQALVLDLDADKAAEAGHALTTLAEALTANGNRPAPEVLRPLLEHDARGYKVAPQNQPGYRKGKRHPAKGRRYPADPPSTSEIIGLMAGFNDDPAGRRLRALVALLWRSGLRIAEALDLEERDIDARAGSIVVREGKGDKRRISGMDEWGWEQIAPWLEERETYPRGPVFCVVHGPTAGWRAINQNDVRKCFKKSAEKQGIRRRMTCHQLRHAHACELAAEGVPIHLISRQLGHANVGVTSIYLQGVSPQEVLAVSQRRRAPAMAATPDVIGLFGAPHSRPPRPELTTGVVIEGVAVDV